MKSSANILLCNPPEKLRVWAGIASDQSAGVYCFPPLGLMYIQAYIEKMSEYIVDIFDGVIGAMDYPEYEAGLKRYNLDLVGVSCLTHSIADTQMTVNIVRKLNPKAVIVLGGPHCEMFPEYAANMDNVDAIVIGDGEQAFLELAQRVDQGSRSFENIAGVWWRDSEGELVKNKEQKRANDLNWQIWPDRRRSDYKSYYTPGTRQPMVTTAITSRGCPHSCPFCLTYKKQYKIRNVDNILDEIEDCISMGITEVHFVDDLFSPNSQWILRFCDAVERRGLKFNWGYKTTIAGTTREQLRRCAETGCTKVHFGVESANNEGLDSLGKHCDTDDVHRVFRWCREEGVRSVAYIMLAAPHERSMEDALQNIDEMLKLDADYAAFAVYSPYPNTESFEEGAKLGLFPADCWDRLMEDPLCGVDVPVAWTEHLTNDQILELLKIAHRKFYFRPKFIARQVLNLKTTTEFKRLASGALSLVKMELLSTKSHEAPV